MTLRQHIRNNGLMIAMFGIFFLALIGMSVSGWSSNNNTLEEHKQPQQSYVEYIQSGDFIEGVFENWESEFLQMGALIVLTIFLRQKGSADSKPMRGKSAQETRSRYSVKNANTWSKRIKATRHFIYSHSLGFAMFALFLMSFALHAIGGTAAYNQDNLFHGEPQVTLLGYVASSQFWYESLQNWQSEFLAVGALMVLSIKLRERSSPESKPVGIRYDHKTGE